MPELTRFITAREPSIIKMLLFGFLISMGPSITFAVETIPNPVGLRLEPVGGRAYPPVITALTVSNDGKMLAAAGDDHAVRLLYGKDFSEQRVIGTHDDWVRSLDFAPDSKMLMSCGNDGRIQVWQASQDWENPKDLGGGPALACVRFSTSGNRVAAVGFAPDIYLLQQHGDAPKKKLTCDCRDLRTIGFLDQDKTLVVGGRTGQLHFFDLENGQQTVHLPLHLGRLRDSVHIVGTDILVTVGEDSRCMIVDIRSRRKISEVRVPECKLLSVVAVDSGHVAVGGSDNTIRIIDVKSGEITKRLVGHQGSVAVLATSQDHLISGSYDTSIRFWKLSTITQRETIAGVPVNNTLTSRASAAER